MAKEETTVKELSSMEDRMREIARNLGQIHKCVTDEGEERVELSMSTLRLYLDWIEAWAEKNVGLAKTAMKAVRRHKAGNVKHKKS